MRENEDDLDLERLTQAGLSLYDLNLEYLDCTEWSVTALGPREQWHTSLTSFVNLITTLPHPAAVLWGAGSSNDLVVVHNLSFGNAFKKSKPQGKRAKDCFPGEFLGSLLSCLSGRTVKVASESLLSLTPSNTMADAPMLLSPLHDAQRAIRGVYVQVLSMPASVSKGNEDENKSGEETRETSRGDRANQKDDDVLLKDDVDAGQANLLDLKESKLFRNFADMLPTGLAILDKQAQALFVNDEFFTLTTNKGSGSGGFRSWPESIHPEDRDRVMDAYRKAFTTTEPLRVEFRCAEGKDDPWRLFSMRSFQEQADREGYLCVVTDISEIKAAELSQRKAAQEAQERKEQQERFIDMVSHEIRNPLSAVLHSADEIKDIVSRSRNTGDDEVVAQIMDAIDTILLCVSHQSTLVDDILSFSKIDAMMLTLTPKTVQLRRAIADCLKLFQPELRAKKIEFEYVLDVSFADVNVDFVVADIKRINQILVNLVSNAIKFTAKNPKDKTRNIRVAIGAAVQRPNSYPPNVVFFDSDAKAYKMDSTLTTEWGDGEPFYLMIAIKDTGIGISAEDQKKLFERFKQATPRTQEKYGGSGLGLFISRKLTHLHGGDIGVSSELGSGSTFGFFFKVRRGNQPLENTNSESDEENATLTQQISERLKLKSDSQEEEDIDTTEGSEGNLEQRISDRFQDESKAGSQQDGHESNYGKAAKEVVEGTVDHAQRARFALETPPEDDENTPDCLNNPPIEKVAEAHPAANGDDRYDTSNEVSKEVDAEADKGEKQGDSAKAQKSAIEHRTPVKRERAGGDDMPSLLLVEDNLINQKVLQRQLKTRGFKVTPANNGQEAVDAMRDGLKVSVVLMDQEMPVMDGNTATKAIRELEKAGTIQRVPILGVSANVREEQTQSMLEAGMDDCIAKPFKVDDLVLRIKGLLK